MSEQRDTRGPDGEPETGDGPAFGAEVIEDLDVPDDDADDVQGGRCRSGDITASQTFLNP